MNLQSKFFIYILLSAIVPLVLMGILSFTQARSNLISTTEDHLSSVATLQERRIREILIGYLQNAKLVASRTQLRISLEEYNESKNQEAADRIARIITDAKANSQNIRAITIVGIDQSIVTSTDEHIQGERYKNDDFYNTGLRTYAVTHIFKDENNRVLIEIIGPLILEGETVGVVSVIEDLAPILAVTQDYIGLGETGEVIIAQKNRSGDALFLTPLRFDAGGALTRAVPSTETTIPIISAINGIEGVFNSPNVIDYRGEPIIAVTRYIEGIGWGIVAKIDRSEALKPIDSLRDTYLLIVSLITFFAVAFSIFISKSLSTPLVMLTDRAHAIERGDLSARAKHTGKDEIGKLSRTFNTMAKNLQELYEDLEMKVKERTRDLQKFKLAVDSSTDAVMIASPEPSILYVNRAWEKLTGYSESRVLGKNPNLLQSKKTKPEVYNKMWDTLKKGRPFMTEEIINRRKDGSEYQASVSIYPIVIDKNTEFYVSLQQDITRRKEADRMKTEFISLASHQLRTPLAAMKWFLGMLLSGDAGKLKKDQEKLVTNVDQSNDRMIALVNALLNISRIESGRIIVDPEETDLGKLIDSVLTELKPAFSKKKQKVIVSIHPNLPTIMLDKQLIRNVYMNLLTNASKYSPEKAEVNIIVSKEGEKIISQISDNGYGIPEKEQSKLFNKFFRASNIVKKDTDGTGLGLYLIKAIIESSGGKIWLKSTEGKGTTFWFSLPVSGMKAKKGEVAIDS